MDLKRSSYQRTVQWTMQGLMEPLKKESLAVVILQRRKVVRCVQFTGQEVISQKLNDASKKTLGLALE